MKPLFSKLAMALLFLGSSRLLYAYSIPSQNSKSIQTIVLPNAHTQRHLCDIDWTPDTRCQDSTYLLAREKPFKELTQDERTSIMSIDSVCMIDSLKASWVHLGLCDFRKIEKPEIQLDPQVEGNRGYSISSENGNWMNSAPPPSSSQTELTTRSPIPFFVLSGGAALFSVVLYNNSTQTVTKTRKGSLGLCFDFWNDCANRAPPPDETYTETKTLVGSLILGMISAAASVWMFSKGISAMVSFMPNVRSTRVDGSETGLQASFQYQWALR